MAPVPLVPGDGVVHVNDEGGHHGVVAGGCLETELKIFLRIVDTPDEHKHRIRSRLVQNLSLEDFHEGGVHHVPVLVRVAAGQGISHEIVQILVVHRLQVHAA